MLDEHVAMALAERLAIRYPLTLTEAAVFVSITGDIRLSEAASEACHYATHAEVKLALFRGAATLDDILMSVRHQRGM